MPLTQDEKELARLTGVSNDVCIAVKQHASASLRRADALDEMMVASPAANAIAVDVADGGEAERVITALEPALAAHGCRAFWSARHDPNGLQISDEVVVMKTDDPYAIVRLRRSSGGNYAVSTDDILDRLRAWESLCTFDCVGADTDWVALKFRALPDNLCTFAAEVYTFCPDSVEQGVGLQREADQPERFEAARQLCPEVPQVKLDDDDDDEIAEMADAMPPSLRDMFERAPAPYPSRDMGIRLLAEEIHRARFLFLWWD